MGHAFWKENSEYKVKLLGSNVLSCCLKISTADLRKRGLKMREWRFKELGFSQGEAMSLTPLAPFLPRKVHLWGMDDPLPTELRFWENTVPL